ncbi:hypothetical protein FRC11_014994 [Ceratobasidium sp. 423]|nr:hypothetical protein FRC11_014994 [Ceratobasidium sp. 423]
MVANAEANELGGNIEASRMSVQDSASKKMLGRQSTLLAQFLCQTPEDSPSSVSSIMSMIYKHRLSVPLKHRASSSGPAKPDDDPKTMARHFMLCWATQTVAESAESEIKRLVGCPELRLPTAQMDWATLLNFSFKPIQECVESTSPTLYNLLVRLAMRSNADMPDPESPRADPNLLLISVTYNTVLRALKRLSDSSTELTRQIALDKDFILVIDNINRQKRIWKPDYGQQDMLMSGTVATLVEAIRCAPGTFDSAPVLAARTSGQRQGLTAKVLWDRIDQAHLTNVLAPHCLNFLASNCSELSHLREYANNELRMTYAIHRLPDGHITQAHPLSSSNHNEGSIGGAQDALGDLFLRQLGLTKEQVCEKLRLVGGDMGTIAILETLITLSSQCTHGYNDFKWLIPLVQLWHMGWADMSRIIATFWGEGVSQDASTFWHVCSLLGQT